jgi:hypothetical protein
MSAAWMHMLEQLCPGYEELSDALDRRSIITLKIVPREKKWEVSFEEQLHLGYFTNSTWLEDVIPWADKTLERWKDCNRISENTWEFKSKKDAEKFQTLFYLSWDKLNIR